MLLWHAHQASARGGVPAGHVESYIWDDKQIVGRDYYMADADIVGLAGQIHENDCLREDSVAFFHSFKSFRFITPAIVEAYSLRSDTCPYFLANLFLKQCLHDFVLTHQGYVAPEHDLSLMPILHRSTKAIGASCEDLPFSEASLWLDGVASRIEAGQKPALISPLVGFEFISVKVLEKYFPDISDLDFSEYRVQQGGGLKLACLLLQQLLMDWFVTEQVWRSRPKVKAK